MIIVPANVNPNAIQIGMVQTGCLKSGFSSAYPSRLNGIISRNEFHESIVNINSKISYHKSRVFCLVVFILCIICGLALVITGGVSSTKYRASFPAILLYTGIGLIGFSSIFSTVGWTVIRIRRTSAMRKAIAEESKKYSKRSPTSCTWRLNVLRFWAGGYGGRSRSYFFYHVIINVHHTTAPSGTARIHPHPTAPRPTSTVEPYGDIPPPPYPGESPAFCSQCGNHRPDLTANFCPSCGHSFNKS